MQLTKNFTLSEFTASPTATAKGITEQFNPPQQVLNNIALLAARLQVARELSGFSFNITSGYRCPRLNKAVGGVKDSAHLTGMAVDIKFNDQAHADKLIDSLIKAGFKRIGLGGNFIHVDIDNAKPSPVCWLYGSKTPGWLAAKEQSIEARLK